jgi:hypothetical protein
LTQYDVSIPVPFNLLILLIMGLLCLGAALTAIISLIRYGSHPLRRKPWYVYFNLAVNVGGILYFVAAMVYGLVNGFVQ